MRSVPLVCLCAAAALVLCGCATMRYPGAYKVEGKEFVRFKDLDDERALKLIALIYNVPTGDWEAGMAKDISLGEYLGLLAKRRSQYIKKSGIFDIKYDKVKIASWKDDDLFKLYDALDARSSVYYMDSAQELSETENARRLMYLTAVGCVAKEVRKRETARSAISTAAQVLVTAASVALSML